MSSTIQHQPASSSNPTKLMKKQPKNHNHHRRSNSFINPKQHHEDSTSLHSSGGVLVGVKINLHSKELNHSFADSSTHMKSVNADLAS